MATIERTASREAAPLDAGHRHWLPTHWLPTHWLFTAIFTAGLALRVLAQIAYQPALLYIDSAKYLVGPANSEPMGYRILLRLLDPVGGLGLVAAVQHGLGLATAVALYALLLRRGLPRWGAALTAAPVLLDAYQLQLEQTIMPDVLFETMIAAGLVLLLWRRRPGLRLIAAGALVLGAATTVREVGAVLIAPTMIFALLTVPRLLTPGAGARARAGAGNGARTGAGTGRRTRRRAGRAALAGACFMLPVVGYMVAAVAVYGHFGLASNGPGPEYGRAAAAADCATLTLPADERAFCPSPVLTLSIGGIDGLLHSPRSPGMTAPVPAGASREKLLASFSLAVLRQQPLRVAASVFGDSARLFALTRDGNPEIPSITRWQFQLTYPTYPRQYTIATLTRLARQAGSGTPVAVSQAGAPDKELAAACLLVTMSAVVLLLASDAFEFSWRYQLPAVVLLPLAGALGLTAITGRLTARLRPPAFCPGRLLEHPPGDNTNGYKAGTTWPDLASRADTMWQRSGY